MTGFDVRYLQHNPGGFADPIEVILALATFILIASIFYCIGWYLSKFKNRRKSES